MKNTSRLARIKADAMTVTAYVFMFGSVFLLLVYAAIFFAGFFR